jgi:hypothetical protein
LLGYAVSKHREKIGQVNTKRVIRRNLSSGLFLGNNLDIFDKLNFSKVINDKSAKNLAKGSGDDKEISELNLANLSQNSNDSVENSQMKNNFTAQNFGFEKKLS